MRPNPVLRDFLFLRFSMKLINSEQLIKKPLVWLEIDTQKLGRNVAAMRSLAPGQKIMAVLKANAYGMGAADIAKAIADQVDMFGVVGVAEACTLRNTGVTKPIVNLGMYSPDDAETLIEQNISPSIFTENAFRDFETQVKNKNTAAEIWVKIDTGLGRLGVWHTDALPLVSLIAQSKNVIIGGIYSTLTEDKQFDQEQLNRFLRLKQKCEENDIKIPVWSIASSSAVFLLSESYMDMIRIGISIFGFFPSLEAEATKKIILEPVVMYKTKVACVKELEAGESIFYRRKFMAQEKTRIAVLLPGYSYGLDPRLINSGSVLIKEKKYPFIGGISATNCFADIGLNNDIQSGDEVIILLDEQLNQNPYEVLSRIPEKVMRLYV